ncbi:hypothetical protein [Aliarcobacter butzleri]|uniref:hypothetical protein n=1 Tax=Aliarcobacter butzleri TaxID=28197 RepID=UPI001EDADFFA|nr:hypothetical protein [Aliarcobacter butzleri]MCG3651948.1 hypothetical protein [Aliarcobacter butzleri]MCG3658632.1 hypothetical protein [Aliarcobacter butzleri]
MPENDKSTRPTSNGSQGTPEKSFSTNNVKSSNQSFPNSRQSNGRAYDSKPKIVPKTPKKG